MTSARNAPPGALCAQPDQPSTEVCNVEVYAAGIFNIILTPDYNAAHHNHIHLDLTPGGRLFR